MSAPARRKKEKKNVENIGEKPIFIFTGRILLLFCSASSVCKVDITLYIVSFLEITAWLCHRLSHHNRKVRKTGKKYCCTVFLIILLSYIVYVKLVKILQERNRLSCCSKNIFSFFSTPAVCKNKLLQNICNPINV